LTSFSLWFAQFWPPKTPKLHESTPKNSLFLSKYAHKFTQETSKTPNIDTYSRFLCFPLPTSYIIPPNNPKTTKNDLPDPQTPPSRSQKTA
jgi:hypothetical protein